MIIPFDKTSNVFDNNRFIADEVTFNLMHRIKESENPILMKSDTVKAIIGQSSPTLPAWIWTDKDINEDECKELADDFYELFSKSSFLRFVAKPEIAEFLAKEYGNRRNVNWKTSMVMQSYHCPNIISPSNVKGEMSKPSLEDINIIAEFLVNFIKDCFFIITTADKQIEAAKSYILSGNFYVWKNEDEIVAMANIAHRSPRHGRINEVYTHPYHRKKGYAGALVSEISKILYKENRTPMLYTDLSNPASNKAYKNVGFVEGGKVTEIFFEMN